MKKKNDKTTKRYLCGDTSGGIILLHLDYDADRTSSPMKLSLEYLGQTTIPHCMSYIDNYVVFIGSMHGDSQLIRMHQDRQEESFLTKLAQYDNLGPIKAMSIVDLEKQGQGQLITASGVGRCGTLRIIRNGVGIQEFASIDLPGIKGLWALNCNPTLSSKHDTLLLSFVGSTLYLRLDEEEVSEIPSIQGFEADEQTLYAGNLGNEFLIQITDSRVTLVEGNHRKSEWIAPDGKSIALCSVNQDQILLAIRSELIYLKVENGKIVEVKKREMENEIACIDVSPLVDGQTSTFCAIGLWNDISVSLLSFPELELIDKSPLAGDIIPRSLLISSFADQPYLFVSIGDGTLFYYEIDESDGKIKLGATKRVQLGTQPTSLSKFKTTNGSVSFTKNLNQKLYFTFRAPSLLVLIDQL